MRKIFILFIYVFVWMVAIPVYYIAKPFSVGLFFLYPYVTFDLAMYWINIWLTYSRVHLTNAFRSIISEYSPSESIWFFFSLYLYHTNVYMFTFSFSFSLFCSLSICSRIWINSRTWSYTGYSNMWLVSKNICTRRHR